MKRLLIPFLALALCPPAQAWHHFGKGFGYAECVGLQLRERFPSQEVMDSVPEMERKRAKVAAHLYCK